MGLTDSRMMPSTLSSSRMRSAEARASGVRMLDDSFISAQAFRLHLVPDARRPGGCAPRRPGPRPRRASRSRDPRWPRARPRRPRAGPAPRARPSAPRRPVRSRLRRSAISSSRAVKIFSSAATASARAASAAAWASDCDLDCMATAMERCCSASSMALRRSISAACSSRSLLMRLDSTICSARSRASSTACCAAIWARRPSLSRSSRVRAPASRAAFGAAIFVSASCWAAARFCLPIAIDTQEDDFSASRSLFPLRIAIAVSCSMSLRLLFAPVRSAFGQAGSEPSASKAVAGIEELHGRLAQLGQRRRLPVPGRSWSGCRRHGFAYAPHVVAAPSRAVLPSVISAATVRSASTNLPSSSSFSCSGAMVRWPSVWRRIETACALACTRHRTPAMTSTPHAVPGDQGLVAPARDLKPQRAHIDGDDTSWTMGGTSAPPSSTTRLPARRPVRTKTTRSWTRAGTASAAVRRRWRQRSRPRARSAEGARM